MDAPAPPVDPQRYFESVQTRSHAPEREPVCLYLETTNRCNLLCTTCPRTYEELEPPADMSWKLVPLKAPSPYVPAVRETELWRASREGQPHW